jgi:hypothetical protein
MLEHDSFYDESLQNMFNLLKSGGLMILTAAGEGREEHGTFESHPNDSPLTHSYYKNLTPEMLTRALPLRMFRWFEISYINTDIRFAGIKR